MSNTVFPRIVDDLCISKDDFGGKTKYFMASDKKAQFFKLSKAQYDFFSEFLPYAMQGYGCTQLDEKCKTLSNGMLSLNSIYQMFEKYHLFEDGNEEIRTKVAIDYNSKKVIEIPLENLNKRRKLWQVCFRIIIICSVLLMVTSGIKVFFEYDQVVQIIGDIKFSINDMDIPSIITVIIISLLAILLHEIGHLLMAQEVGIEWKSINISLIWGLTPIFYVRYKNFCIHKSKDKIKVLFMGAFMNFIQILIYLQLCILIDSWVFMVGILINAGCILSCIMPLGTSDGYQILAITLGIESARWKALGMIGQVIKKPRDIKKIIKNREEYLFIGYVIAAYVSSIFGCVELLKATMNFFNLLNITSIQVFIIIVLLFGVSTFVNMKKLIQNISNFN
uniref:hypothetical protein n=1 Tax=Agathobacter sp. TaxID=2021311 RepID=UPI0040561488